MKKDELNDSAGDRIDAEKESWLVTKKLTKRQKR